MLSRPPKAWVSSLYVTSRFTSKVLPVASSSLKTPWRPEKMSLWSWTVTILYYANSFAIILCQSFCRQISFRIQCRHTPAPGGRDRLAIDLILDITGGKNPFDVGAGRTGDRSDITGFVHIEKAAENGGIR